MKAIGEIVTSASLEKLRARLFDLKRDILAWIDDAEARNSRAEIESFRQQLEEIRSMIERAGGDPDLNPPRRTDS